MISFLNRFDSFFQWVSINYNLIKKLSKHKNSFEVNV